MKHQGAASGLWALLWRAAVFFPLSCLFLFVLCAAIALLGCLPIMAVLSACASDWWEATAFIAGCVPVVMFLRWWWRRERSGKNWGEL
jgi:hypothetical protein